jgi:hypothetical protein
VLRARSSWRSSPEAISQSLRRRRERLDTRLRELEVLHRGTQMASAASIAAGLPSLDDDDLEDLEEAPDNEVEAVEEEVLDQATAARSIPELKIEIATLQELEALALDVCRSGADTRWCQLAGLLSEVFAPAGELSNRCWKLHFRRLSSALNTEMAVSESLGQKIRQDGEQSAGLSRKERFLTRPVPLLT